MAELIGYRALNARIDAVVSPQTRQHIGRRWQILTVRGAKLRVPRKTSNLGRTIQPGLLTDIEATVVVTASYAAAVELGTRPHLIRPRPGRVGRNGRPAALAWGGARRLSGSLRSGARPEFFARWVNHPGTRPRPFLRPAAEEALHEEGLVDEIIISWNGAA